MLSSQSPGSSSFQPPPGPPGSFPPPGPQGLQGPPFQPPGSQVQLPLPAPQVSLSPQKPGSVEPPGIFFRQPTEDYNIISTSLGFAMVVFGGIQACLHVILAFNRLTAILFPHRYRTFWNGKSFYAIVSLAFIIPSFLYFWILYYGANVLMSPVFGTYVIDTLRTSIPWLHKATINTVIITITCVMAFAFDLSTFILLQKRNFVKTDPSKYNQEFRLLTVSVAFLIVHTLGLFTAVSERY
uniref:Serpentine receptor class gamma n=1 Tax=Panagrolaimus sp. PS1159 TaxID=55785 RepID=A0AC35FT36_9BILA